MGSTVGLVHRQEGGQCGNSQLGEGPSDRRTQRKQDRPYRTLGHGEEFCFHSEMRTCWKLLSGEMICSDICFEGTTLPILDTLEVKGRSTDS